MIKRFTAIVSFCALIGAVSTLAQEPQSDQYAASSALLLGDGARGEAIYAERCSGCHARTPALGAASAEITTSDLERIWTFFDRHYLPDEAERADVIAHLAATAGEEAVQSATAEAILEAGDRARGAAAYASDCAGCHAAVARLVQGIPGETQQERALWLWTLLATHHAPEPSRRGDITTYLAGD